AETFLPLTAFAVLLSGKRPHTQGYLLLASSLVIAGILLNRFNNFITAYRPFYDTVTYVPSVGEVSVTIGCIALLILIYRLIVIYFPVISHEKN
ncbi:MAG TPA: hypothetical protein PKE39_08735, partial [Ignavibacteria bacterium]|nr:hypothetical protein [Ignavibacteria bacterium]